MRRSEQFVVFCFWLHLFSFFFQFSPVDGLSIWIAGHSTQWRALKVKHSKVNVKKFQRMGVINQYQSISVCINYQRRLQEYVRSKCHVLRRPDLNCSLYWCYCYDRYLVCNREATIVICHLPFTVFFGLVGLTDDLLPIFTSAGDWF